MPNYISQIEKIVLDIKTNEDNLKIDLINFSESIETKEEIASSCKELFNYSMSDSLLEFYSQIQSFELQWSIKDSHSLTLFDGDKNLPNLLYGSIKINPWWQILPEENWDNNIWFLDDDPSVLEVEKKLRPFDYFNSDLSGSACFYIDSNNHISDELLFFSHEGGYCFSKDYSESYINDMNSGLRLEKYIGILVKTRGWGIWQRIYESMKRGMKKEGNMSRYNHYMSQLFDNYDFSKIT